MFKRVLLVHYLEGHRTTQPLDNTEIVNLESSKLLYSLVRSRTSGSQTGTLNFLLNLLSYAAWARGWIQSRMINSLIGFWVFPFPGLGAVIPEAAERLDNGPRHEQVSQFR